MLEHVKTFSYALFVVSLSGLCGTTWTMTKSVPHKTIQKKQPVTLDKDKQLINYFDTLEVLTRKLLSDNPSESKTARKKIIQKAKNSQNPIETINNIYRQFPYIKDLKKIKAEIINTTLLQALTQALQSNDPIQSLSAIINNNYDTHKALLMLLFEQIRTQKKDNGIDHETIKNIHNTFSTMLPDDKEDEEEDDDSDDEQSYLPKFDELEHKADESFEEDFEKDCMFLMDNKIKPHKRTLSRKIKKEYKGFQCTKKLSQLKNNYNNLYESNTCDIENKKRIPVQLQNNTSNQHVIDENHSSLSPSSSSGSSFFYHLSSSSNGCSD